MEAEEMCSQVVDEAVHSAALRPAGRGDPAEEESCDDRRVEEPGGSGDDDPGASPRVHRGESNDDQIEDRYGAGKSARVVDQTGDEDEISGELNESLYGDRGLPAYQHHEIDETGAV